MDNQPSKRRVDWGHIALILLIAVSSVLYLLDTRATSLNIGNIALVQPAAIIVVVLSLVVLAEAFPVREPQDDDPDAKATQRMELMRVGLLSAAFAVFVLSLEAIGFDLATLLFIAVGLFLCGERRLWLIAVFSLCFTGFVVFGYQQLVPESFPMMLPKLMQGAGG